MKTAFDFGTLAEFLEFFKDEETCRQHFAASRFANGEFCPHCGHRKIYSFKGGKRYRCADCKQDFTIATGTVFGESKLPLRKWYIAVYLLLNTSKGISSVQLAKHVGVTQKTGWFMDHRIREAIKRNKGQLFGTVECDETYVGGAVRNMHKSKVDKTKVGPGGKGKAIVFGIRSRAGEVRAKVVPETSAIVLHQAIRSEVAPGATVYTDEHRGYNGMADYKRGIVCHSQRVYVDGDAHTNGIESFWALFKRGYHGVYHWMSRKHMQRYVDEFAFRWNQRPANMKKVFSEVVDRVSESRHLGYNELTGKTPQ